MRKELFDLQKFAQEQAPVEETETTPTEEVEEETPEFDDSEEETKDEKNPKKETEQKEDEGVKKNTNKENAQRRIAEKRRKEQERLEQENKKLERSAYLKGIKMALGDKNPYTDKPIVDDEDLQEYEIMKKLEEDGKDPITDYAEYIKNQRREEKNKELKQLEEEQAREKFVKDSIDEVEKKYGKGTAEKYLNDDNFMEFYDFALDNNIPLSQAIDKYNKMEKYIEDEVERRLLEKDARRKSSPGGINDGELPKKDYSKMSKEEFQAVLDDLYNS